MKLDQIREKFLEYFRKNGHEVVASSSLIPEGDPTLMFTNAGMNQFKDVFLGAEKRSYNRAATAQKCFRASGKHNDLENVGRTARHHTFFEMLGNFSFGDYFKEDAIKFSWELMTEDFGLPKDKLIITVYKDDDEAFDLWREVAGVPEERILRLGEKDNFWQMGDTGPCGPCSEIHIDQGEELGCGSPDCGVECECDRYLELWNLVFMQYDRDKEGNLNPLPRPSIDTGMGIERIAAVLQGKFNNYDIDHFQDIIGKIGELTEKKYRDEEEFDVSLRVMADHARAMTFLIADGVLPSNEGRGYVLRRVMRRAGRHAKMLGKDDPVLYKVCDHVVDLMGDAYPELVDKRAFITEVVRKEEERFLETLDAGLKILQEEIFKSTSRGLVEDKLSRMAKEASSQERDEKAAQMTDAAERQAAKEVWKISGDLAFKLYDTYGFPLDLTQVIAEEEGLEVDVKGFEEAMQKQKQRARESWKGSGEEKVDAVYQAVMGEAGPTEFLGYKHTRATGRVVAIIKDGGLVDEVAGDGERCLLVSDRTPFYGESGGQVGDTGRIEAPDGDIEVEDAKKPVSDLIVHHCVLKSGKIAKGDTIQLLVDESRRGDIKRNHSATHILQYALRQVLGDHVNQKGSLVTPDRLRFDLTHFNQVSHEEIREVETIVNRKIRENSDINIEFMPYKESLQRGAIALFGEKYGERVRLVEMGDFSKELCGGTHAERTGDIGAFKIAAETSVAAGVRRIEALTGRAAIEHVQAIEDRMSEAAECLKTNPEELKDRINRLQDEIKSLRKELKNEREKKVTGGGETDILDEAKDIGGIKVLSKKVDISSPKELRPMGDAIKDRMKSGVAVLGGEAGGKAHLLAVVTKDLTDRIKAGDIVKEIAPIVGGKGGGRPDFAQAGGPDPDKVADALKRVFELVEEKTS